MNFIKFIKRRGAALIAVLFAVVAAALVSSFTFNTPLWIGVLGLSLVYVGFEFFLYKGWHKWINYYAVNIYRLVLYTFMAFSIIVVTVGAVTYRMGRETYYFIKFLITKPKEASHMVKTPTWKSYSILVNETIKDILKL